MALPERLYSGSKDQLRRAKIRGATLEWGSPLIPRSAERSLASHGTPRLKLAASLSGTKSQSLLTCNSLRRNGLPTHRSVPALIVSYEWVGGLQMNKPTRTPPTLATLPWSASKAGFGVPCEVMNR